jgi:hypothetical protein
LTLQSCAAPRFNNNNKGTHMSKEPKNLVLKNQEPKAQEIMLNAVPVDGYVLLVDGKLKTRYESAKDANEGGAKLKQSYPVIQIAVYDATARSYTPVTLPEK